MVVPAGLPPSGSAGPSIHDLVHPTNASPIMKKVQIETAFTRITTSPRKSSTTPKKRTPKKPQAKAKASSAHDDSEEELSEPPELFNTDSEDEKDLIVTAVTRIERRMDQSDDDYNPTSRSRRPSTAGSGKITRASRTATRSRENSFAFSVLSPKVPRAPMPVEPNPDAPKRKRGRPRKIVLESPIEVDADSEDGPIPVRPRKILPLTPPSDTAFSPLQQSSAPPSTIAKRSVETVEVELAAALAELNSARKEIELLKIKCVTLAGGGSNAGEQIQALREDVQSLERSRAIDREGWELERGRLLRRIKTLEGA